jgi:glycosyltransferase involved in cell wall biosynthesis
LRVDFRNRLQQVIAGGFTAGHPWARYAVHGQHAFADDGLRCVGDTVSVTTRFPLATETGDRIRIRASAEGSAKELAVFAYDGWKRSEELLVRLPLAGTGVEFELRVEDCWLPDAFGTALHLYASAGVVLHEVDWLPADREAPSSPFVRVEPPHAVAAVRRDGVIVSWGAALHERGAMPAVELRPSRPSLDDEEEQVRGLGRRLTARALARRQRASVRVERRGARSRRSVLMLVHDQRIDRRVLDEARTLLDSGWDVTVAAGPADPTHQPTDEETYPDVPIVRATPGFAPMLPHATPGHLAIAAEIPWARFSPYHHEFLAEALARQPEVIVAHDLPQLGAAVLAAAETGSRVVYDSHEVYPEQRHLFNQGIAWPLASLEDWLLPLVDETLTVNESIASFLAARYGIRRPSVILNAPQPPSSSEPTDSAHFRERLRIPAGAQMLLYQGAYAPTRNLENLMTAFADVRDDVVLVMLGPGFEEGSAPRRLARDLGLLGTRVFFHEPVGQKELLSYTAMADAGVIPYVPTDELAVYWCTPNKLFEFIVAGIPVLASDLPELRRFVGEQGIGFNRSFASSTDIAAAVDEFFSADLPTMRARARELSSAHAWPVQAARLRQIFERLADRPPRASVTEARTLAATRAATISAAFPRLLVHGDLAAAGTATLGREWGRRSAGRVTSRGRRYAGRVLRVAGLRQK